MNILIVGSVKTDAYAEELRKKYSSSGTACYSYHFEEPVTHMHYNALLALRPYLSEEERKKYALEHTNPSLTKALTTWVDSTIPLTVLAGNRLSEATSRWRELGMHYYLIIYGGMELEHINHYTPAFRVYLKCNKEENRLCLDGLNDCAISNIFDIVVDINETPPEEAANLIAASLRDKLEHALSKKIPASVSEDVPL